MTCYQVSKHALGRDGGGGGGGGGARPGQAKVHPPLSFLWAADNTHELAAELVQLGFVSEVGPSFIAASSWDSLGLTGAFRAGGSSSSFKLFSLSFCRLITVG